jgi:hypothetical protein
LSDRKAATEAVQLILAGRGSLAPPPENEGGSMAWAAQAAGMNDPDVDGVSETS